jgi:hypothetical protein
VTPSSTPAPNGPVTAPLELALSSVELHLVGLGDAMRQRDVRALDHHASELRQALTSAADRFSEAARSGPIPSDLRERFGRAGALVAAQRESLARATAALDRAIEALIPREATGYGPQGARTTDRNAGSVQA